VVSPKFDNLNTIKELIDYDHDGSDADNCPPTSKANRSESSTPLPDFHASLDDPV
jgi:hypothetical protein